MLVWRGASGIVPIVTELLWVVLGGRTGIVVVVGAKFITVDVISLLSSSSRLVYSMVFVRCNGNDCLRLIVSVSVSFASSVCDLTKLKDTRCGRVSLLSFDFFFFFLLAVSLLNILLFKKVLNF